MPIIKLGNTHYDNIPDGPRGHTGPMHGTTGVPRTVGKDVAHSDNPGTVPSKLDKLAQRLGVKPHNPEDGPSWLVMCDGTTYDIFDLANALLDRLDDVEQQIGAYLPQ